MGGSLVRDALSRAWALGALVLLGCDLSLVGLDPSRPTSMMISINASRGTLSAYRVSASLARGTDPKGHLLPMLETRLWVNGDAVPPQSSWTEDGFTYVWDDVVSAGAFTADSLRLRLPAAGASESTELTEFIFPVPHLEALDDTLLMAEEDLHLRVVDTRIDGAGLTPLITYWRLEVRGAPTGTAPITLLQREGNTALDEIVVPRAALDFLGSDRLHANLITALGAQFTGLPAMHGSISVLSQLSWDIHLQRASESKTKGWPRAAAEHVSHR